MKLRISLLRASCLILIAYLPGLSAPYGDAPITTAKIRFANQLRKSFVNFAFDLKKNNINITIE